MTPFFSTNNFTIFQGDCLEIMPNLTRKFNMIFADPPYFLSNGGITVQSGKMVSVNKGDWDKSKGFDEDNKFNEKWLRECRNLLTENGTIWVSGTYHNIFSVAQKMTELNYKILNCITWAKTNPPPNLSCKYFTHSTEFILWARKNQNVPHYFNYELMREMNGGKQMKDVWNLPAIAPWEKSCGKHPTQKPLSLLYRIVLASSHEGDLILDPFTGSSTTGISANLTGRNFIGIDKEPEYLVISKCRRLEIEKHNYADMYLEKLKHQLYKSQTVLF